MKVRCFIIALVLLMGAMPAAAQTVVNPHRGEHCNSCHLNLPEQSDDGTLDYGFLAEEIDPTCEICHLRECCTIGAKEHTHASGIDDWDEERYGVPDELPLKDGYITCVTCHYWRRESNESPTDYKLVRLVEIKATGVDWTVLCADCHKGY